MTLIQKKALFHAFFTSLGYLFLFILFGLFLDSRWMPKEYLETQTLANASMIIGFAVLFYKSSSRLREQMLYAVFIGIVGEHLFSIMMHMYTYRLGRVPIYVPPGHAIVYISTLYFCKKAVVKLYRTWLEKTLTIFILTYATLFLIFANDIFGFIMSLAVIYLMRNRPRERLFFFVMYVVVAFLEIVGTTYQCWSWPSTAYDVIPFLKSSNPPSGISLFYFLLDLGCLWLYKQRHRVAWRRMKFQRKLRLEK